MKKTRLLIASVPPLLGDIVRDALESEPGVEVVGRGGEMADLDACDADVVLAEEPGPALPDPWLRLMYRHPRLRLLTVSPDGRRAPAGPWAGRSTRAHLEGPDLRRSCG